MYTQKQDIAYVRGTLQKIRKVAERDDRRTAAVLADALMDFLELYVAGLSARPDFRD